MIKLFIGSEDPDTYITADLNTNWIKSKRKPNIDNASVVEAYMEQNGIPMRVVLELDMMAKRVGNAIEAHIIGIGDLQVPLHNAGLVVPLWAIDNVMSNWNYDEEE